MNYTKKELQAILSFVRTAKVDYSDDGEMQVHGVKFSYDDGNTVDWITRDDLVSKLKREIRERENG